MNLWICVWLQRLSQAAYVLPANCPAEWKASCMTGGRKGAESCGKEHIYYPSYDPDDPCCPKYNCICEGMLEYTYNVAPLLENCTVIKRNIIMRQLDDPATLLNDIEDVWGEIYLLNNGFTELNLPNLRIVRGIYGKAFPINIQEANMKRIYMPKLTEVSRGWVLIFGNFSLHNPIYTIDWYGEIFEDPCNPNKVQHADGSVCQSVRIKTSQKTELTNLSVCHPNCTVVIHSTLYKEPNTIASIYGEQETKNIRRCWDYNTCQIITRSHCNLEESSSTTNEDTGILHVNRCVQTPNTSYCNDLCRGGCFQHFSHNFLLMPSTYHKYGIALEGAITSREVAKLIETIRNGSLEHSDNYKVTCATCNGITSQLPGKHKCLTSPNDICEEYYGNLKPVSGNPSYCFKYDTIELEKIGFKAESLTLDKGSTVPDFCENYQFQLDLLTHPSTTKEQTCKQCRDYGIRKPSNGFSCSYYDAENHIKEDIICYGPGNPQWNKFLEERGFSCPTDCEAFTQHTIHFLEDCTVLDGNFILEYSSVEEGSSDHISSRHDLCKNVRNLHVITGCLLIHSWIGTSLDCFENLEEISGKTLCMHSLALYIATTSEEHSKIKELNMPKLARIRNGDVQLVQFDETPLCQAKIYNPTTRELEDNKIWNKYQPGITVLTGKPPNITNIPCYKCHDECDESYGCVGGSDHDCAKCRHFKDMTKLQTNLPERLRAEPLPRSIVSVGNYLPGAILFDESDKNIKWRCVKTCPEGSYMKDAHCLPCHQECLGCTGPSDMDCKECRDGLLNQTQCVECSAKKHDSPFNIPIYYTEDKTCKECDAQCLTACVQKQRADKNDCQSYSKHLEGWCYEKIDGPMLVTYIGDMCKHVVSDCSVCENGQSCSVKFTANQNPLVHCGSNWSWFISYSAIGVALLLSILCFIAWMAWRSGLQPTNVDDFKAVMYPGSNIIDGSDLAALELLGAGNFGDIYAATLSKHIQSTSLPEEKKHSVRHSETEQFLSRHPSQSKKQKGRTIRYKVAVKKFRERIDEYSVAEVIQVAKDNDVVGSDYKIKIDGSFLLEDLDKNGTVYVRCRKLYLHVLENKLESVITQIQALQHDHLIRLIGITKMTEILNGEIVNLPARMVVDFADEGSLDKWIRKRRSSIDERHASKWLFQIAKAMKYLEENKILHHNLAVRNILLLSEFHVAVSDFGLEQLSTQPGDRFVGEKKIAPFWSYPPEALRKHNPIYNHKSDVWAFGITTWEILTLCQYNHPYQDVIDFRGIPDNVTSYTKVLYNFFVKKGGSLSQPSFANQVTCSSDFWFNHLLTYLNIDSDLRPSFKSIEDSFENTIHPEFGDYFSINRKPSSGERGVHYSERSTGPILLESDNEEDVTPAVAYVKVYPAHTRLNSHRTISVESTDSRKQKQSAQVDNMNYDPEWPILPIAPAEHYINVEPEGTNIETAKNHVIDREDFKAANACTNYGYVPQTQFKLKKSAQVDNMNYVPGRPILSTASTEHYINAEPEYKNIENTKNIKSTGSWPPPKGRLVSFSDDDVFATDLNISENV